MSYAIKINEDFLNKAIKDYKEVKLTLEQESMIIETSRLISQFLEIPELAIQIITWKAHIDWQKKHEKVIADIANLPPVERLTAVKELFNIGKKYLKDLLSNREEQELLVDIAFDKAFKLYLVQAENATRIS